MFRKRESQLISYTMGKRRRRYVGFVVVKDSDRINVAGAKVETYGLNLHFKLQIYTPTLKKA